MKRSKVATVQMDCEPLNTEGNMELALNLIRISKRVGAELVVLPHMFATGYNVFLSPSRVAETMSGPTITFLKMVAQKIKINIIAGFVEKCNGRFYDTSVIVDPKGEIIGSYRRACLWQDEAREIIRGENLCVVDTSIGKVGLMVARDFTIPEIARSLAFDGAEILAISSATEDHAQWEVFVRARAMENACFVVATNRIGVEGDLSYCGHSMIVSPNGLQLSDSDTRQESAVADLHPRLLSDIRSGDWQLVELMNSFGLDKDRYLSEPIKCRAMFDEAISKKGVAGKKKGKATAVKRKKPKRSK